MTAITKVRAIEILDSRGNPTVQVTLENEEAQATAKVPSGASTGQHEAHELRDDTPAYNGKGVRRAVENVTSTIAERIENASFTGQEQFDQALIDLDGTQDKSRLGANAILGCSMAYARLHAKTNNQVLYESLGDGPRRLPTPYANILNGGDHAGNDLAIQECMIAPSTTTTFSEATRVVAETYHELKAVITEEHGAAATGVGDEGGFAPPISDVEEALSLIERAAKRAGHADDIDVAIDAAANEFYNADKDVYEIGGEELSQRELASYYADLVEDHGVVSLEDPFHDDDFDAFSELTAVLGDDCQVVGDDLTVTNPARVERAVDEHAATALLLKVNQIGTVTEAIRAARIAQDAGWNVMVSHRSGETEDAFIADLAVAINASQAKIGAPCRGERTAKYNRLLTIENQGE